MKAEEKNSAFISFRNNEVDILISTSVIEVGINNPNATIMSILNPERFGLSSLHQMRGRVGRGDKPGFCFLVNDKQVSATSLERLNIIENNIDGFKIAEEDLRIRGEGNLFGKEQSGIKPTKVLASLIEHQPILEWAKEDVDRLKTQHPELFKQITQELGKDDILYKTI
jgi:ATP-dependent DNA helicase RecG